MEEHLPGRPPAQGHSGCRRQEEMRRRPEPHRQRLAAQRQPLPRASGAGPLVLTLAGGEGRLTGARFWRAGPVSGCPAANWHPKPSCRCSVPTRNVPAGVDPAPRPRHPVGDVQRVLGSNRTLHHAFLVQPCRRACALLLIQLPRGKIICRSRNNIPLVVRGRVGAGWAGDEHPPVAAGSGTEELFILEQGRGAEVARREH